MGAAMSEHLNKINELLQMKDLFGRTKKGDEVRGSGGVYLDAADCRVLAQAFTDLAYELDPHRVVYAHMERP